MPSLPQRWAMASPSSCPVCLPAHCQASSPPSPRMDASHPKISATRGRKAIPCGHCGVLEGVDHRHVKGSISSPCPERHQDIRWAAVSTWQQEPPLFAWPKSCTHCRVKEGIFQQGIVPAYSLSSCSAAEGVVTHDVAETEAGWALGRDPRHRRLPQPVLDCQNKL